MDFPLASSLDDDEYPDVDRRTCRLLGPTALIVQALMGVLVILSLVLKRHREKPKRPWRVWSFDVSKQVAGQIFVHGVNVLISDVVAHLASGNPCVLYFLNILIDTTFGVGVIYLLLRFFTYILSKRLHLSGFVSGQYGDPPQFTFWLRQTTVYVIALTSMKLLVVGLFAAWPGIFKVGDWLLSWTGGSDAVQVIVVMGLFPIIMNIIQFWLIDSIVKSTDHSKLILPISSSDRHSEDNEPLFAADHEDILHDAADTADDEIEVVVTGSDVEGGRSPPFRRLSKKISIDDIKGTPTSATTPSSASHPGRSRRSSGKSTPDEPKSAASVTIIPASPKQGS